MRWLLTGGRGLLGTDADLVLRSHGLDVTVTDRRTLDITAEDVVEAAVRGYDVVLNCAAWTAVDDAETRVDEAFAVNAHGTRLLARSCARNGTLLVHISTDYVFDGTARSPYPEAAPVAPGTVYGRSKAAGESAVREEAPESHLILRGAWLYGAHGSCFPRTIGRLLHEQGSVDVVDDQSGQPTWTRDVADLAVRLVQAAAPSGTYHATSSGETTWCGFACEVAEAAGFNRSVVRPTSSTAQARPAARPAYSVLGHQSLLDLGIGPVGDWRERWRTAADEVLRGL